MNNLNTFKKMLASLTGIAIIFSYLSLPCFTTPVFADGDTDQEQDETQETLNDVTDLGWAAGSLATLEWTASENANRYLVVVTVYDSNGTNIIGSGETGTSDTQIDIQDQIQTIVGDLNYDTVKVTGTVYAQKTQDDVVIVQSDGVSSGFQEYTFEYSLTLPIATNLQLSDDYILTFEYDVENSDITYNPKDICLFFVLTNGSKSYSNTKMADASIASYNNGIVSIDLSEFIEKKYDSYALTGPWQISFAMETRLYVDGRYYQSEQSDYSNAVAVEYEVESLKLPTATNLQLSDDYILTFEYDVDNSDITYNPKDICLFFVLTNGSKSYSNTKMADASIASYNNGIVSIDLSGFIEKKYDSYALTGPWQISFSLETRVYVDGRYYQSERSDSSNAVAVEYEVEPLTLPTATNLQLSDDYILTFEYDVDNSDITYNPKDICLFFVLTNGSKSYSNTKMADASIASYNNGIVSIDLSGFIEKKYDSYALTGPWQISFAMETRLYVDGRYYQSEQSEYSNAVTYSTVTPIENILISPEEPMICQGNSYYLGKTIYPNNAYYEQAVWSSDNESIVKVDANGQITGVGVGTANVTVKIWNVSATVPVTVYSINSNIEDSQENAEVISTAGEIIDDIVNNENPNLDITDIDPSELDEIKDDVIEGITDGDSFNVDIVAIQQYFNLNSKNWGQVQKAAGDLNAQFEGAYNIEVEMYHKDTAGNETHIGNITEFDNEITFTFDLPTGMKEKNNGNAKKYVLVRIHTNSDGTVEYEQIDYTINNDGTFTATSDKYSDFIWVSVDADTSTLGETGTTPAPSTPTPTPEPEIVPSAELIPAGSAHVQDVGDVPVSVDPETGIMTLGTTGQGKRLEEIVIDFENTTGLSGTMEYRVHVQDIGWMDWTEAGNPAGTEGLSKRIEAIEIRLTGDLAKYYSVEYCVHIQDYGDMQGWVADGALAGTTGESKRIEQIKVRIVPKGSGNSMSVMYRVHIEDFGWESTYASDGAMSGTSGQSKRLEAIEIFLTGGQYSGGIKYKTHVQDIGWESSYAQNGEMSGTQGQAKRLEGISIELYGEVAKYYDIYYRVHAQDIGWMGWAKNGEYAGTAGRSARLEGIQIVLVPKGGAAPGATYEGITASTEKAFIEGF